MRDYVLTGQLKAWENSRRFRWLSIVGRLKPRVSVAEAKAAMKTIAASLEKEYPRDNKGRTVELYPLNQSALGINQRRQFSLAGGVLMGVVGLVLLIACVNLANLLLAQAAKREKELSIRAAMGAGRFRLVRQLLTESTVLSLLGAESSMPLASAIDRFGLARRRRCFLLRAEERRRAEGCLRCPRPGIHFAYFFGNRPGLRNHPGH